MSGTAIFMAVAPLAAALDALAPETAAAAVYATLRQAIVTLELPPGSPLRVQHLSARLDAGPTPVREALWRLSGEGLVSVEPQRGFRVATLTRHDLQSLALLCHVTEPAALRQAIRVGGPAWVDAVRAGFADFAPLLSKVGDHRAIDTAWEQRHRAFHMVLLAGCGLPELTATVAGWYDRLDRYRRLALPSLAYNAATADDHAALLALVEQGAEDAAVDLLGRHLVETQAQLLGYFDGDEPAPGEV